MDTTFPALVLVKMQYADYVLVEKPELGKFTE